MDVTMGSIRVVILLHKEKGEVFLWPAVRQQPKDVSLRAILGKSTSLVKHFTHPANRERSQNFS